MKLTQVLSLPPDGTELHTMNCVPDHSITVDMGLDVYCLPEVSGWFGTYMQCCSAQLFQMRGSVAKGSGLQETQENELSQLTIVAKVLDTGSNVHMPISDSKADGQEVTEAVEDASDQQQQQQQ